MKKFLLSAAAFAVVAVSAIAVAPNTAEAVPAFARQTGAACWSCHFQAIPRLSAFGRNFRMNAFRDMGEQALLEDEALSLPAYFNASLLFKARIVSSSNNNALGTGAKTAVQWPDETAILLGGRYGEHFGGVTEWNTGALSYKFYYVFDLDNGIVAVGGGSTDALGNTYVFSDPSNTLSRPTRGWQHRANFLSNGGTLASGVTGLGAYAYLNNLVYVAVGGFIPHPGINNATAVELKPSLYSRVALTTEFGGFDTVLGAYYMQGKLGSINGGLTAAANAGANDFAQYGVDLQLQGDMGDVSVGFYLPVQLKGENPATVAPGVAASHTGYYPMLTLAFGHFGVRAGYDYSKLGGGGIASATTKTSVVGAWWSVAQNVELDLEYQNAKVAAGSTNQTTLLLEYVY